MSLERRAKEFGLGPEIRGQIAVSLRESVKSGSHEILKSSGLASGASVAIVDSSEMEQLLGSGSADDTGTTRSGHKSNTARAALASDLHGHSVHVTDLVTPISTADRDEAKLGINESALDGDLDLLGDLAAESDVTVEVTDGNDSLETGALAGLGLLLDRDDLHNIVL